MHRCYKCLTSCAKYKKVVPNLIKKFHPEIHWYCLQCLDHHQKPNKYII